jgi:DNA repair protein RecN (Recombination protein N)
MLETLRIRNYALIEEVEAEFRPGFNALTGETGAGKSIIIGALNLVLGARASGDVIRAGADKATIEAAFRIETPSPRLRRLLDDYEIELDGGALLLSRVIGQDGRTKAFAGGRMVTVSILSELGDELVDLHGQHEHQSLLKTERQLDLLDGFGGTEPQVDSVAALVGTLRERERTLTELENDDRDRARQVEFLKFELEEILKAGLAPGEEEALRGLRDRITHAETIYQLAGRIAMVLYDNDEGAATQLIGAALHDLEELAGIDAQFRPLAAQLDQCRAMVEEVAQEVRGLGEGLEYDADELERINGRLALIRELRRKYGSDITEILAYAARAREQVANYEQRDERVAALRKECAKLRDEAEAAAQVLSKARKAAARKLDKQVTAALQDLGMKGARFETAIDAGPLNATGIDKVRFELAANPGEALKPLKQVASGGEVSRIMLALKTVFAKADRIPTLIFDEIDAGVGGGVAVKVAEKIRQLAQSHQILCITHIAQIAAVAQAHFHVSKSTEKKRTETRLTEVSEDARVQEVARLLDGAVSKLSEEHARELLAKAAG